MKICHKSGKRKVVPDALSRLAKQVQPDDPDDIDEIQKVDALYSNPVILIYVKRPMVVPEVPRVRISSIAMVEMSDEPQTRLRRVYENDAQGKKILDMIKSQPRPERLSGSYSKWRAL